MNTSPFLLIFFLLSTCHGDEEDHLPASGNLATTKAPKVEKPLEVSCPEPTDIEPCVCSSPGYLSMDCSKVQDEEQLREVFSAFFPSTDFQRFYMGGNTGLKVLEDGVFGDVTFQELIIRNSVLETVTNNSLRPSLSTLTSIHIELCQLAIFPLERLADFTSLVTLSLYSNKIQSLPPLSSSSLEFFDLGDNPISYLSSDVFTLVPAIEQIYFYGSSLTEITPGTFRGLPELFNLNLYGNKISYLQSFTFDLVSPPTHTAILELKNNSIDIVEVNAFNGVQGPSTINMANNALTGLEEDVWRPVLERDIDVNFEGNSLSCGCDVAWLIRDPQLLAMTKFAQCADGTLLTDLDPADFDMCG